MPPPRGGKPWLALVFFMAVLAAVLLRLGWVDPRPLAAAALFEALRAVAVAVFRRTTLPPATSSDDHPADEEGG